MKGEDSKELEEVWMILWCRSKQFVREQFSWYWILSILPNFRNIYSLGISGLRGAKKYF